MVFGFMSRWLLCFISWSFVFLHFAIAVLLCLQYSVFWVSCGRLFLILRLLCDQPAIQCLGPAAVSVCLPSPLPPPNSALGKFSMCILNCSFLSLICMSCFSSSSSALLRCPKLQTVVVQFIFSGQGRPHIYSFLFFCQSFVCHASLGQGG